MSILVVLLMFGIPIAAGCISFEFAKWVYRRSSAETTTRVVLSILTALGVFVACIGLVLAGCSVIFAFG